MSTHVLIVCCLESLLGQRSNFFLFQISWLRDGFKESYKVLPLLKEIAFDLLPFFTDFEYKSRWEGNISLKMTVKNIVQLDLEKEGFLVTHCISDSEKCFSTTCIWNNSMQALLGPTQEVRVHNLGLTGVSVKSRNTALVLLWRQTLW